MEGVEGDIHCQTEDLGNVTPTLRLTRLGLAAQTWAGVETVPHIAIVVDVFTIRHQTSDLVGYHSTQSVYHCCLAPCKSVPNYGPLTEPKIYIVKFGRTAIPTLNGIEGVFYHHHPTCSSKFSYCQWHTLCIFSPPS